MLKTTQKEASDLIIAEAKGEIIGGVIVEQESCTFSKSLKVLEPLLVWE